MDLVGRIFWHAAVCPDEVEMKLGGRRPTFLVWSCGRHFGVSTRHIHLRKEIRVRIHFALSTMSVKKVFPWCREWPCEMFR